ncbi:uncharacterized protein LOC131958144 [Physella acuta]|uniref:uncharacterized protein LOC131958144 n=1 Tax=Physella acuta TaxID=109671 RepID=UPI0027DAF666|nr:uncharacterized protein LOC131958144 [Physella acuta]
MSDSQSPNEYPSKEKKSEGSSSRSRTSRNADKKNRKKIRHIWDAYHEENDDDYYLSSGTHIHTNVLSETYPKEYSIIPTYSLNFDDEDFKDAYPPSDRHTGSSISPSILGLSGSIGFSSSDKEELMSHEEHGDAVVREEQFLDIPDSPKHSPVSSGHHHRHRHRHHPGGHGSHPVSDSQIQDSPGPHQFLECIACSSLDDCIALEKNPELRKKLQSNGSTQKSLNSGKVFLICGTSPPREETKVARKSSKHVEDGTKVSRKSSKIDEPVLQDHRKQSSDIIETPVATRSRKIQVRPHTDKSTQFTPAEGEDEQPRDIREPQVVRSKSISADDGFRYKEDQTTYDRQQRASNTDQRNLQSTNASVGAPDPKGGVLRHEANSNTDTEQTTHHANLSKRESVIQSSRGRTYSLNTINEKSKSMTGEYRPYVRHEPILPHLSSRYSINTGPGYSVENKNSLYASRTQIPREYGRHEPLSPYSSSRYGRNKAPGLSVENKNSLYASRTQIPHLIVGGEYGVSSALPDPLKHEALMNSQVLLPQALLSMPRQDPLINYQMSSSQPNMNNQIFQPQPILNNTIPAQQQITNSEIPQHRPLWNNQMSLQNPNMNNLITQPQSIMNNQLSPQYPNMNNQLSPQYPNMNNQLSPQYPNMNNQLSPQYPNMNNQLSPQYPNMNNQLSPQYPNMNNQLSPQYPNMNNQLSPQYPNMNNQLSPQYPNMDNQLSPQYPNMNNQLSPQYPNMNNQLSPQYPNMNNQLSPQYPNMNNQLSPQYPNMDNQLSPQYPNMNNQLSSQYPNMNNPISRQYSSTNHQLCQPHPTLVPPDYPGQCPKLDTELHGGHVSHRDLCGYSPQMAYGDTGNQGFKGSNQSPSKSYPSNSIQPQRPLSQTTCVPRVQFQEASQHLPNALICGNRQENANTMMSPIDACDSDPLQDFSSTSSYPSGRISRFQTCYSGESRTTTPNQSSPRLSQLRRGQPSASPSHIPETFTNMPVMGSESQSYFSARRKQPYYTNRGNSPRQHRRNNFEAPQHFDSPSSCEYRKGNASPVGREERYLMDDPMLSVQDEAHYAKRCHLSSVSRHSSRSFCRGNDDRMQSSSDESLYTPRDQRYATFMDDVDDPKRGPARRRNVTYQLRSRPGRVSNSKSCYDNTGGRHGSDRESCYDNGGGWHGSDRECCYDNGGGWHDSVRERGYASSGGYLGSDRETFDNDWQCSDTRSCYNDGGGWSSKNKPARKRLLSEGYSEPLTPRYISRSTFGTGDYRVVDRHFSGSASKVWDKHDRGAPPSWSYHSECPGVKHSPPLRKQSYQAPSSASSRRSSRGDENEDDDDGKSSWVSDE